MDPVFFVLALAVGLAAAVVRVHALRQPFTHTHQLGAGAVTYSHKHRYAGPHAHHGGLMADPSVDPDPATD